MIPELPKAVIFDVRIEYPNVILHLDEYPGLNRQFTDHMAQALSRQQLNLAFSGTGPTSNWVTDWKVEHLSILYTTGGWNIHLWGAVDTMMEMPSEHSWCLG